MSHHKPWKRLKLIFDDDEGDEVTRTSGGDLIDEADCQCHAE